MPYCVHCGVKLSEYNTHCPLCDEKVLLSEKGERPVNTDYPVYRTESVSEAKRVNHIFVGRLLSMIFFNYAIIVLIVNLSVNRAITWSQIPMLSIALVWFGVAVPFFRKRNTFFGLYSMDSLAVIVFLILLDLIISGGITWSKFAALFVGLIWSVLAGFFINEKIKKHIPVTVFYIVSAIVFFVAFAFAINNRISAFKLILPVTGLVFVIAVVSYFIITARGGDFLGIMTVALISTTIVAVGLDVIISNYLTGHINLSWALIVSAVTVPMFAVSLTIKKSRELKAIISKKLHR